MSRLLSRPEVRAAGRPLSEPDPSADPYTLRAVEEASDAAYERGRAEGRREALEEARQLGDEAGARAAAGAQAAITDLTTELREFRHEQSSTVTDLARGIAEVVLGREPHDGGHALLRRCQEALAALDDTPLVVHANPADATVLRGVLDADVVDDPALSLGEARVRGTWGRADLTRAAAWELVGEALESPDE